MAEGRTGFVHLEADGEGGPTWYVFAVDLDSGALVAAKRLQSDERGENLLVTEMARDSSAV